MSLPSCRFCSAPPERQAIKGEVVWGGTPDQHFWLCAECGIIYLYPKMNEAEESKFYAEDFENFMHDRSGSDTDWSSPEKHYRVNRRETERRMGFLGNYLTPGGKALEVGCSSGFLLSAVKEEGMEVFGIEPSKTYGGFAASQGIHIFPDLNALHERRIAHFDLLVHYYVLEHIRNPVSFLRDLMALVKPGGFMVFEVPSATDPLIELYHIGAFDRFYWSVVHHWYFSPNSLERVLGEVEKPYELFPEQRYDLSNHLVWMQYGKPGGLGRYSEFFGEELDRVYRERLKQIWLCDTIIGVVRA